MSTTSLKTTRFQFILAILLIFFGGLLAYLIQTSGGVEIKDIRFKGKDGLQISALLYIPEGVSKENPAPGIVATHGYINSRETQDGFAIEFARRGYVVLAPDQTGHGYSDPPAFANGFGGMDTLKYMRTLDFVDKSNIALEGHSMGGWASVIGAAVNPGGYKSFVLASSSTGTYGAPPGNAKFPRNMALIFSEFDEFSGLMWGSPVPKDIVKTDKLKKVFGTSETVEVGKLYGSIEEGTARKLYQPPIIHPKVHFSTEAIGNAIEWIQMTLDGGKDIAPDDQIWYWKEIGTFIALLGMVLLLFPVGRFLLNLSLFEKLKEDPSQPKGLSGAGWWVGAVITVLIPIPVYLWAWGFNGKGIAKASYIWPQQITTTIMFWALGVGLISLVLFLLWHFLSNAKKGGNLVSYGLGWQESGLALSGIVKSFILAAVVVFIAHLTLAISDLLFTTDYRIWVFAIKPLSSLQFGIFFGYLIPFVLYFLVLGVILHGQLRKGGAEGQEISFSREVIVNIVLLIAGYILFLLFQYLPLFSGGTMSIPEGHLLSIVLFQFVPIFMIVGLVSTYFYRKTGHVYTGAFINAMFVTWTVVAGQATHFPY